MAYVSQLPCDGDGVCMLCKTKPPAEETLSCKTCGTPWHASCLSPPPETLTSTLQWECPDCSTGDGTAGAAFAVSDALVAAIRAIESDGLLTEREKAQKRQELLGGKAVAEVEKSGGVDSKEADVLDVLGGSINCSFCMQLPERPVTTPCGHNFCLKCFERWVKQGKRTCIKCRSAIPPKMASQPRINSALVVAIRMAKMSKLNISEGPMKVYHFVQNQNRPDEAFMTERARRSGKSNAASGKIFVTTAPDHFGPIPAENDPIRNQGVLVGECWEYRLECRQWGVHLPHVSGIAGQSKYGAQSVILSGGYLDDEDHGEWFLYTGSGGRDLSGNKRTNKNQSFDQKFESFNRSLLVSCMKGYPVRVLRSHKEKRSSYAPEKGLRYDGVYRIEKCWRKVGVQGFRVCRYLFVRCDNEPAPWTSDEHGDRPRPVPPIPELKKATGLSERKESPSWDFDEEEGCWKWKKPPPPSKKSVRQMDDASQKSLGKVARKARNMSVRERLLKEFSCLICRDVMALPVTTPCAHNFCKLCLEGAFAGKSFVRERSRGGRALRSQKNVMNCPSCPTDISDYLHNPQVNRELMHVIESLKSKAAEEKADEEKAAEENEDPSKESTEEEDKDDKDDDLEEENKEEENDNNVNTYETTEEMEIPETKSKPIKTNKQKNGGDGKKPLGKNADGSNADSNDATKIPKTKPKPTKTNKRKKVDAGDCPVENGGDGKKPVGKNVVGSNADSNDAMKIPKTKPKPTKTNKRKKVDAGDCPAENGGNGKRPVGENADGPNADSDDVMKVPETKPKPTKTNKRKKVDVGDCPVEKGGDGKRPVGKNAADGLNADSDGAMKIPETKSKPTKINKGKKVDVGDFPVENGGDGKKPVGKHTDGSVADTDDAMKVPETKTKPTKTNKRKKVNVGVCPVTNGGDGKKTVRKNNDGLNADSELSKVPRVTTQGANQTAVPAVKHMKKAAGGGQGVGVKTRSGRKAQAPADGDDSPLSPLLVHSNDNDFE